MRVCVIDDDNFILEEVKIFFETNSNYFNEGKISIEFFLNDLGDYKDVDEFFEKEKINDFDVVVTDFNMPNFNGENVVRKLLENKFKGNIICYSRNYDVDIVKNLEKLSKKVKVLDKSPRELLETIENIYVINS